MSNTDRPMLRKLGHAFTNTLLVLVVVMLSLLAIMANAAQAPVDMIASDGTTIMLVNPYDLWVEQTFEADSTGVGTWLFSDPSRLVFMAAVVVGSALISIALTASSRTPDEGTDE